MRNWQKYTVILLLGLLVGACTTTDPYTGQARVDQARTAALLGGLALAGAAAYAINKDRDDDDDYRRDRDDWHYANSTVFYPAKGIVCYGAYRECYKEKNGKYSKRWTHRIYPRSTRPYDYKRHND